MEFLKQMSGDNVKGILKDTIMVLCQNSVPHNFKLSIDAIIGITVDDTNVLLININDVVDKSSEKDDYCITVDDMNYKSEANSVDETDQFADDEPVDNVISTSLMDVKDGGVKTSDMPYFDYAFSEGVGATLGEGNEIVDEESDATISGVNNEWNTGCTPLQHDSIYANKCRSKTASAIKIEQDDPVSSQHQDAVPQELFQCNMCTKLFSNQSSYLFHNKVHHSSSDAFCDGGDVSGVSCEENSVYMESQESCSTRTRSQKRTRKKTFEEEQQTFYVCNICGSQIRHLRTFKRHKFKHEGVVFQCEICEKTFTRRDYLQKHSQSCALQRFQETS